MPKQQLFEMPKGVVIDEKTRTATYARMAAEPFEAGYGNTMGNALRRVLLSSLEGAAITSVHIDGVSHEFTAMPGVFEDVTHIILNLKKVLFKVVSRKPFKCEIKAKGAGPVTAGRIDVPGGVEILNPDHHICTIDGAKTSFNAELTVEVGTGYRPAESNKKPNAPLGVIPLDSLFSPVSKVKYAVEAARVGQRTDYDRLILEVWTDGRVDPVAATVQSADLLADHIAIFQKTGEPMYLEGDAEESAEEKKLTAKEKGAMAGSATIEELGLSKRTTNALINASITKVPQLLQKTERELMELRNFGEKALSELNEFLKERNWELKREPATDDEIAALMKKSVKKPAKK